MECWLSLPFLAFSLSTHHALHDLTTSVYPEQCHHHRQCYRTYHDLDSFAKRQTNRSICFSFVDIRTTSSSQVQSSQLFAPDVWVLLSSGDTLSLHEVPKRSSILVCFSRVGRSIHRDILSSQESQDGVFLHGSAKANTQVRTTLVDSCCPNSESGSTSFHFSQQTVAPRVLSLVFVLIFSGHLCTNDIVLRNHRICLDLHPRLLICLSISTLLLSLSSAANADTTGYFPNVRVCLHVTGFGGSTMPETQGTDVTDARCPASQHTMSHWSRISKTLQSTRVFTSNSARQELCAKLIQAVHQLGLNTQFVKLLKSWIPQ